MNQHKPPKNRAILALLAATLALALALSARVCRPPQQAGPSISQVQEG